MHGVEFSQFLGDEQSDGFLSEVFSGTRSARSELINQSVVELAQDALRKNPVLREDGHGIQFRLSIDEQLGLRAEDLDHQAIGVICRRARVEETQNIVRDPFGEGHQSSVFRSPIGTKVANERKDLLGEILQREREAGNDDILIHLKERQRESVSSSSSSSICACRMFISRRERRSEWEEVRERFVSTSSVDL